MFFSSVFDPITKANVWPPKAAGKFVVFWPNSKQMVPKFRNLMSIYTNEHIYVFWKFSRIMGIYYMVINPCSKSLTKSRNIFLDRTEKYEKKVFQKNMFIFCK